MWPDKVYKHPFQIRSLTVTESLKPFLSQISFISCLSIIYSCTVKVFSSFNCSVNILVSVVCYYPHPKWAKRCLSMPCQALPMICGYHSLTGSQQPTMMQNVNSNGRILTWRFLKIRFWKWKLSIVMFVCHNVIFSHLLWMEPRVPAWPPPAPSQVSALTALSQKCLTFLQT